MRVAATRRDFLMTGGAAAAAMILPLGGAEAMPLGIPPGLQLWTVKDELAKADRAAEEAREKVEDATRDASRGLDRATDKIGEKVEEAGEKLQDKK